MKLQKLKSLLLCALMASPLALEARTFNDNGSGAIDQSLDNDQKVHTNNIFTKMIYEPSLNLAVFAHTDSVNGVGNKSLVGASFADNVVTTFVAGTLATTNPTGSSADGQITEIVKIQGKVDGQEDRFATVHLKATGIDPLRPFVVDVDGETDPTIATLPANVQHNNAADAIGLEGLTYLGQDSDGMGIFGLLARSQADIISGTDHIYRLYKYNFSNSNISDPSKTAKVINKNTPVNGYVRATMGCVDNDGALYGVLGQGNVAKIKTTYFDPILKCTYFAYDSTGVSTNVILNPSNNHRRVFVAVARLANAAAAGLEIGDLIIENIFHANHTTSALLYPNISANTPITSANTETINFSVNHVKTMHPSSGNPLLILQANRTQGDTNFNNCVYALPLVPNINGVDDNEVGKLADTNNLAGNAPAQSTANIYQENNNTKSLVGGAPLPVADATTEITDLKVLRDSVFVCVKSANVWRNGIYASTALFDENGQVAGWTAWTRVLASASNGATQAITQFDINEKTNQLVYCFGNNGIGVTNWSNSGSLAQNNMSGSNFMTAINQNLGANLTVARHFPAIKTAGLGSSSLTVLGGRDTLTLVSTGAITPINGTVAERPYIAEMNLFSTDRVKKFNASTVGDVYCAAVAKVYPLANSTTSTTGYPRKHGYLFVGGSKGLAVLCKTDDGTGWDGFCGGDVGPGGSSMSIALNNLTTGLNGFELKSIGGISEPIHDVVCTDSFLYALSSTTLYRIRLHTQAAIAANMFPVGVTSDNAPTMFGPTMETEEVAASTVLSTAKPLANKVVVQKVLQALDEYFICLENPTNTDMIFVGSVNNSGSTIYCTTEANNSIASTIATNMKLEPGSHLEGGKITIPGKFIRRIQSAMINTFNETTATDENNQLLANLFVLTGHIGKPDQAELWRYPVYGLANYSNIVATNFFNYNINTNLANLTPVASWHHNNPGTLLAKFDFLPTEISMPLGLVTAASDSILNKHKHISSLTLPQTERTIANSIAQLNAVTPPALWSTGLLNWDSGTLVFCGSTAQGPVFRLME